jgi:hypothetical protein
LEVTLKVETATQLKVPRQPAKRHLAYRQYRRG